VENLFPHLEQAIVQHAIEMGIINHQWAPKKVSSLVDAVISAVIRSRMTWDEFLDCLNESFAGRVVNLAFFDKGGNVWDYVDSRYHSFAKALWAQRSTAIGTPNAASGEGELMFLFLSPDVRMPARGDLNVGGVEIELKGNQARVQGRLSGNDFRQATVAIAKKHGLTPNLPNRRSNGEAAELEKKNHESHWVGQLARIQKSSQEQFLFEWLKVVSPLADFGDAKAVLNGGFDIRLLQRTIVKLLYADMVDSGQWAKIVFLGDGSSSIVCDSNTANFNRLIDDNKITLGGDYFRIWQGFKIGWYIEPN